MPPSTFAPLTIPAALWRRDDVGRALDRRDVGALLRLLRRYTGASQTHLGLAIGLPQASVSRYMGGHRTATSLDLLERVADGLAMPDSARRRLGLAPHTPTPHRIDHPSPGHIDHCLGVPSGVRTPRPGNEEVDHTMRRRRFMNTLTGLALGTTSSLVALEAVRHGLAQAADTRRDRDHWDAVITEHAHAYYTTAPDTMTERLGVDLEILQYLLAEQPDDRDLNRAAAALSMVLAACLTDTNEIWLAHRWYGTARDAAERSGDTDTLVTVLRWQAIKGLYDGTPLPRVLGLADEALALAGDRITPGVAGAQATRAQALATSGRPSEAVAALRAVAATTERMPTRWLTDDSLFGWPEHRLRHTESYVYTEIGDTTRASAAQDRALALYTPHQATNRGMVQMHRATCLITQGDIDTGLRYATDTLDSVPLDQHSQLLYAVARKAVASLPPQERRRAHATDLSDRLTTLPTR